MATKILGTKLEYNDVQFLLGLAKDAKQRRIVKSLFGYQLKMIERLGLTGIDNCKQFHNTWLSWITDGCPSDKIVNIRCHHGHKARLQHAQRLYTKYVQEGDLRSAQQWRDTVTTVLRSYQVCGPSNEDMQYMWNDSIKNNITQPLERNVLIAILRGCLGVPSRYNEACDAQDVYICCSTIRQYFDMIERIPRDERKGFYRALSSLVPDLNIDDFSLLIKKGPHRLNNETIVSIFGEALDMHALQSHVADCFKVNPEEVASDLQDNPESSLFIVEGSIDLLTIVHDLNETLLDTYKHSPVHKKVRDLNLTYSSQIPQGEIPTDISVAPGRTVLLQDKAGKTRPISIATYTVNNALAPLHEQMFKILRRIRQDSTDQSKGINHIQELTSKKDQFICSADLSSATDRLPVVLQTYILYRLLRLSRQNNAIKIANLWYQIMTGTEFQDPMDRNSYFRYGAGQPMGVYTSWPMLALTNHIMIRAAYYLSRDKSLDYLVCGDDTVIAAKQPFLYYEQWMNSLGVKINRSKSHICEANDPIKVAEFCKRLAVNGEIVSSESPKVLIRASRDPAYQPAAINCIQEMLGPISNAKLASLVGDRRLGDRRLALPYRYGGWGQINSEPFHEVLMKDNYIFLYIYKRMRSKVSALETTVSVDSPQDQSSIDNLSVFTTPNPQSRDWRLMGRKVYTPINLCRDYLYRYEQFITGKVTLTPTELVECVKTTFDDIDKCLLPLKISSKDDNSSKSKLAIFYSRMFTRTIRNISSGNVHTFSLGFQSISIDLDWDNETSFTDPKDLINALDMIMFDRA